MKQEIIRINLGGVNCYLGKTDNGFILFDTGGHLVMDKQFTNRCDILEKELNRAGCNYNNLHLIVLTHGDNDHICNVAYLRDKYDTKIAIHQNDCKLAEDPSIDDFMSSFNYSSVLYKVIFKLMKNMIYKISMQTLDSFEKFTPDIFINDKFYLRNFGFYGEVIHVPGHTAGSIVILTENGELIAGDTFSNIKKPTIAPNASDFKELLKSVEKLKHLPINMVYPGHGEPFQFKRFLK